MYVCVCCAFVYMYVGTQDECMCVYKMNVCAYIYTYKWMFVNLKGVDIHLHKQTSPVDLHIYTDTPHYVCVYTCAFMCPHLSSTHKH